MLTAVTLAMLPLVMQGRWEERASDCRTPIGLRDSNGSMVMDRDHINWFESRDQIYKVRKRDLHNYVVFGKHIEHDDL